MKIFAKSGQVAIEFLMYIGIAFMVVFTLLAAILTISKNHVSIEAYESMDDIGISIQQELLLASQLEDGYTRRINMPMTIEGKEYIPTINQTSPTHSYLLLSYDGSELLYLIPVLNGNIALGNNILRKRNGILYLNQT